MTRPSIPDSRAQWLKDVLGNMLSQVVRSQKIPLLHMQKQKFRSSQLTLAPVLVGKGSKVLAPALALCGDASYRSQTARRCVQKCKKEHWPVSKICCWVFHTRHHMALSLRTRLSNCITMASCWLCAKRSCKLFLQRLALSNVVVGAVSSHRYMLVRPYNPLLVSRSGES